MKKNQLLCMALAALLALCCVSALAESAAAPVYQQPTKDGKLHGHWYGEWFPTRVKHHTAFCRYDGCGEERETSCERITLSAGEATTAKLCPVCGGVDGVALEGALKGVRLELGELHRRLMDVLKDESQAKLMLNSLF